MWACVPYATRLKNQLNISCSIAMFHGEFGLILCSGGACPPSIYGHLSWWISQIYKEVENRCWHSCFFAVIWSIWLSRNEIIFNKVLDTAALEDIIKVRITFWVKARFNLMHYSTDDFKRCIIGVRKAKGLRVVVS